MCMVQNPRKIKKINILVKKKKKKKKNYTLLCHDFDVTGYNHKPVSEKKKGLMWMWYIISYNLSHRKIIKKYIIKIVVIKLLVDSAIMS